MRSESPEERGLQKAAGRPSYRIENEYNPEAMPQYFQISVGVLEGRSFAWQNPRSANSFVIITLGKKKHRTGIQRNKQEPLYRESFSFEMYATMYDLQRSPLCLTVMESRCYVSPRLLGEVTIDLAAIWEQPHHRVFHKWVQLSLPRDPTAASVGFLKVDISITCRGDLQSLMTYKTERNVVPVNYFMSSGSEQQHANFMMTIHGAFGLPNTSRHQSARHHCAKPPSTFVRVFFCGLQAKTAVQNRCNNPMYCERVSMVEMFPNSRQTFRIEVCSTDSTFNKILASTFLNLDNISHDGENGYLPTFGPSLLPLYGSPSGSSAPEDCPYYRGSLLVSLNTVVPYYQQSLRSVSVEPVSPIPVENLWALRDFCIFCPIFEVSMLDSRVVSHSCGVAVTIGELPTGNSSGEEFTSMMNEIKTRKLHYTGSLDVLRTKSEYGHLDFSNSFPILQAATRLPDYRYKIYRNNAIARIVRGLESVSKKVDDRLKSYDYNAPEELLIELNTAFHNTIVRITAFIDIFSEDWEQQYKTDLDKKQIVLQIEEMIRIRHEISQKIIASIDQRASFNSTDNCNATRKTVKILMAKAHTVVYELKKLIFKATEGWPDIVIWLLNDGSRVGFCKIRTADVIYSDKIDLCGEKCGIITTYCFKPLKCSRHVSSLSVSCFCVAGKVELLPWMGLHEHGPVFERALPTGCKLKIKDFDMCVKCGGILVECRVFIHKARILCYNMDSDLRYVFLRINTLNTTKESEIIEISSAPVWNQILRLRTMMFTSTDRLTKFPPVVLVEVIITDLMNKTDIIGSFEMNSVVDDRSDFNIAPKLQWHEVYNGMESTGKVFMSVQILQITERVLKSTIYNPIQETFIASDIKEFIEPLCEFETLPSYLIPETSTYKIDIYWWGLRNIDIAKKPSVVLEIEDITLKSDVITHRKNNCNFSNPRISQVFEASFAKQVCTTLNMKLYDNCTFGRTVCIGKKAVKKPNKFFINWYTKDKRDSSLRQASITSADFIKVSQTLYIKKRNPFMQDDKNMVCSESSSNLANNQMKHTGWRRLFRRKELDEEEYTLLPVFTKQSATNINKKNNSEHINWWSRYVLSEQFQNNAAMDHANALRITIYDSELEHQPQFSKFKDWCAALKLYSGEKTGVPEKDLELQCGLLKAGIVIYKWPPPDNVIAVSSDGVDLTKGFFYDFASNVPAKFLIRVYVIKAFNLTTKSFAGKSNPYVVVSCGGKNLGDRNNYIKNTYNPVFGTLFEVRCTLPEDYQLSVSLYNYDVIEPDGFLGSTTVDLEDRIYTKHRACVGLPSAYNLSDPGKWRDFKKPSAILEEICLKNHLIKPNCPDDSTVVVNGVEYKDNNQEARSYLSALERRENICLNLLRNWEKMSICGYHLVPEHVETRSLYTPEVPEFEQGKLHMWIDIYPLDSDVYIPPSVDITPNKAEKYELKVTIFQIKIFKNVIEESFLSDRKIHVRAWLGYADQMQSTNFCEFSSDGQYDFNWSMIFKFNYEPVERKIVRNEANQSFTAFDESASPIFMVQLVDSDYLSSDEPIGFLALNLTEVSHGVKNPRCLLKSKNETKTTIDLFSTNTIVAWWPLQTSRKLYEKHSFGAIKLGLSLISQKNTLLMPVGLEKDIQLSSPKTRSRNLLSHKNYSKSNSNVQQLIYHHNALWGSLTGVTIIILVIFTTVYFIYVYV